MQAQGETLPPFKVCMIPRSREVGQSYLTSIWTTLVALWVAFSIVYRETPQLVCFLGTSHHVPCERNPVLFHLLNPQFPVQLLVNGPGTCIPICLAARLLG